MRVASRRLQQVLDLIFPKPLPREARRLRRKIRRCRRALGDLRNCDVLLQQVQGRLARKRCSHREAWTAVKQHLQERRSESFSRAIRKLSKVNLAVFYMRAKEILDRLRPTPDQDPGSHPLVQPDGPALEPFPARLTQALAGVWREFEKQVASSHRETTAPSIHAARICAKRLRYLLEVVNQFGIPGSSECAYLAKKNPTASRRLARYGSAGGNDNRNDCQAGVLARSTAARHGNRETDFAESHHEAGIQGKILPDDAGLTQLSGDQELGGGSPGRRLPSTIASA